MKTMLFRGIAIFFILIVATSVLMDSSTLTFGTVDFFQNHGFFFLLFITFFPRLTLIFSSVVSGGIIWWAGLIFCPRILVASLATMAYFHTNPILVVMSWLIAFGGEVMEKKGIGNNKFIFRMGNAGFAGKGPVQPETVVINKDDVIEAEFTKK